MADRRYHVASLLIIVIVWTDEVDTKTISVDANVFANGAKPLPFRLKKDKCARGLGNNNNRTRGLSTLNECIVNRDTGHKK